MNQRFPSIPTGSLNLGLRDKHSHRRLARWWGWALRSRT